MTVSEGDLAVTRLHFVRQMHIGSAAAAFTTTGAIGWLRANLVSTPFNIMMTVLVALLADLNRGGATQVSDLRCLIRAGSTVIACLPDRATAARSAPAGRSCGSGCAYFIYGSYPIAERWRVDVFFALLARRHILDAVARWRRGAISRRDLLSSSCCRSVPFILLRGWRGHRLCRRSIPRCGAACW